MVISNILIRKTDGAIFKRVHNLDYVRCLVQSGNKKFLMNLSLLSKLKCLYNGALYDVTEILCNKSKAGCETIDDIKSYVIKANGRSIRLDNISLLSYESKESDLPDKVIVKDALDLKTIREDGVYDMVNAYSLIKPFFGKQFSMSTFREATHVSIINREGKIIYIKKDRVLPL